MIATSSEVVCLPTPKTIQSVYPCSQEDVTAMLCRACLVLDTGWVT